MKYYLKIGDTLFLVSKKEYKEYYRALERWKYTDKLERRNTISLDRAREEGMPVELIASYKPKDVEDEVLDKIDHDKLSSSLKKLNELERRILRLLYFEQLTEREAAKKLEISQTTLNYMKERIVKKLRRTMNNL